MTPTMNDIYSLNDISFFFSDIPFIYFERYNHISIQKLLLIFLKGITVLSKNLIQLGVGYQFADRLIYSLNVLFLLKKVFVILL